MKTGLRVLIILVVAAAIAGMTLAVLNVSGVQASQPSRGRHFSGNGGLGSGQFALDPAQEGFRSGHGVGEVGSFSLAETVKNLTVVAIIVMVVVALERLLRAVRRKRLMPVPVRKERTGRKE